MKGFLSMPKRKQYVFGKRWGWKGVRDRLGPRSLGSQRKPPDWLGCQPIRSLPSLCRWLAGTEVLALAAELVQFGADAGASRG